MAATKKIKVLVVDDHAVVRMGLSHAINGSNDFHVCAESADGAPVMALIAKHNPGAVVLDLTLKDADGLELLKEIHSRYSDLPVLVLSMHAEMVYAERALRAGAMGYVHKEDALERVVAALRVVVNGDLYTAESVKSNLLKKMVRSPADKIGNPMYDRLSNRELEVFRLLGQGMTTRTIAEKWHRSVKTVETYRANIKRKLDLKNSAELVRDAVAWQSSGNPR